MNIEDRVKKVFADNFCVSTDELKSDSHMNNDFYADSLDEIEIMMMVEEEFMIEISDEDALKLKTVGDYARHVESVIHDRVCQ